jgi:hypothetical protein
MNWSDFIKNKYLIDFPCRIFVWIPGFSKNPGNPNIKTAKSKQKLGKILT